MFQKSQYSVGRDLKIPPFFSLLPRGGVEMYTIPPPFGFAKTMESSMESLKLLLFLQKNLTKEKRKEQSASLIFDKAFYGEKNS